MDINDFCNESRHVPTVKEQRERQRLFTQRQRFPQPQHQRWCHANNRQNRNRSRTPPRRNDFSTYDTASTPRSAHHESNYDNWPERKNERDARDARNRGAGTQRDSTYDTRTEEKRNHAPYESKNQRGERHTNPPQESWKGEETNCKKKTPKRSRSRAPSRSTTDRGSSSPSDPDVTILGPAKKKTKRTIPTHVRTVEECLEELERAYEREALQQQEEQELEKPTPKASTKSDHRQESNPEWNTNQDATAGSSRDLWEVRENALRRVTEIWRILETPPQAETPMIDISQITKMEETFLKRGKRFIELVPSLGINAATKKARKQVQASGRQYSADADRYLHEISAFNSEILRRRLNR